MKRVLFVLLIGVLFLVGCVPKEKTEISNPASIYCEDNGGRLEIRNEENGQVGYCLFEGVSECEEWAFFRGECNIGKPMEE